MRPPCPPAVLYYLLVFDPKGLSFPMIVMLPFPATVPARHWWWKILAWTSSWSEIIAIAMDTTFMDLLAAFIVTLHNAWMVAGGHHKSWRSRLSHWSLHRRTMLVLWKILGIETSWDSSSPRHPRPCFPIVVAFVCRFALFGHSFIHGLVKIWRICKASSWGT